jgi:alanyl-tRNA synthetase
MTANEIRHSFLKFFELRGHTIVPSASVIPQDDPTLLFTNAGMNQFKDVFLGTGTRSYKRAVNSQKCIRVSGKHNDLEEVGRDTYHHTFFEMLGNWSFGDYYKKEAIAWAWELLTKEWKLDKSRLYATVYETDDEAEQCWKSVTNIDHTHILRFGKKDNFWEMGETGPCGPCSEIHYDMTDDLSGGKLINAGDPRVIEIWNLVFIQYDRDESSNLTPLPSKHVDTGMGFERICAVLQGKKSNYETDVFTSIIERICHLTNKQYTGSLTSPIDTAIRVIADHVRMLTFSIADGGIPSNEGRGYVMRRILRRAARFGRNLDTHEPFIYKVVDAVVKSMGNQFPEIRAKQSHVERVIKGEEESFNATLDRGIMHFENEAFANALTKAAHAEGIQVIQTSRAYQGEKLPNEVEYYDMAFMKNSKPIAEISFEELRGGAWKGILGNQPLISGDDAFKLYDTYGFPYDLTEMMARERGLTVDRSRFEELMEEQRERSRGIEIFVADMINISDIATGELAFIGYEFLESETEIIKCENNYVVLKSTPFYGESGGQLGDTGDLKLQDKSLRVLDTQKRDNVHIHVLGTFDSFTRGQIVKAIVDKTRRLNIMRNHTATHIVHEALRRVLDEHLHQQGSLVAPDRLRFDFNHFEKISPEELKAIEDVVNEKIDDKIAVEAENNPDRWITIDEAKRRYPNVKMFFGEKYGEKVRIVVIDPKFSVELCGGTHVKNTKDIGLFKIISESSIASGIRRIEAVTGDGLQKYIEQRLAKIGEMDEHIAKLIEEKEMLEKELGLYKQVKPAHRPSLGTVQLPTTVDSHSAELVLQKEREREQSIETITKETGDLKKELSKYRVKQASSSIERLLSTAVSLNGFKVVSARIDVQTMDELKSLGDTLRAKLGSGVGVLASVVDNKVALVCVVTDDLIKTKNLQAGKIVSAVAKSVGGSGGGRSHLATAGGKDITKLDEALRQTLSIVQSMLP